MCGVIVWIGLAEVTKRKAMVVRSSIRVLAQTAALLLSLSAAQAHDENRYPNLKGQWDRAPSSTGYDPSKPQGAGQRAPLTAEYQAVFDENLADQARGGQGTTSDHTRCGAAGMPFMMVAFRPIEFIVSTEATYIIIADYDALRRVFTDGRDWPKEIEATYAGYSIGKWIDQDGDGRFDVLEVETRGFKGPRIYDAMGLPLHTDNKSIFRERIYLDRNDPNILHDEMTVLDNALTRPWTVDKKYVRNSDPLSDWPESICTEYNAWVIVGKENYYLSADGYLMPARPGQAPPDLRYWKK
jgi:hypothetical protein